MFDDGPSDFTQGIDLTKVAQQKRFTFVDGLTGLFASHRVESGNGATQNSSQARPLTGSSSRLPATSLPLRRPPIDSTTRVSPNQSSPSKPLQDSSGLFLLDSPSAQKLTQVISSAIQSLKGPVSESESDPSSHLGSKITLIVDSPDILLATHIMDLSSLLSAVSALSQSVHSSIISVSADPPLLAAATASMLQAEDEHIGPSLQFSELEQQGAGLVTSLAHRATWVLQLHKLETGWAKDVSGVLAISRGGSWEEDEESDEVTEEKELLYYVKGDGSVKVFERGSGGG